MLCKTGPAETDRNPTTTPINPHYDQNDGRTLIKINESGEVESEWKPAGQPPTGQRPPSVDCLAIIVPTHCSTRGLNKHRTKGTELIDAPTDKCCSVKIIITARLI